MGQIPLFVPSVVKTLAKYLPCSRLRIIWPSSGIARELPVTGRNVHVGPMMAAEPPFSQSYGANRCGAGAESISAIERH